MLPSLHALTLKDAPRKPKARKGKDISMTRDGAQFDRDDEDMVPGTPPQGNGGLVDVMAVPILPGIIIISYYNGFKNNYVTVKFPVQMTSDNLPPEFRIVHSFLGFDSEGMSPTPLNVNFTTVSATTGNDAPVIHHNIAVYMTDFLYRTSQVEPGGRRLFLANAPPPYDFVTAIMPEVAENIFGIINIITNFDPDSLPPLRGLYAFPPEEVEASLTPPPAQGLEKAVAPAKPAPQAV